MVYRQNQRSERVREASRHRILAAARKLFARRGYAAATMRDIAKAANTSIGNLYFYFGHKDELMGAILAEGREPVWAWVDEAASAVPHGPSRLAISAYANLLRLLTIDRDLMRLFLTEGLPASLTQRAVEEHLGNLRAIFKENFPEYSPEDLELVLSTWSGASRRCAERFARGELGSDPVVVAEFLVRWNLRGLGLDESEIEAAMAAAIRAVREGGFPFAGEVTLSGAKRRKSSPSPRSG